MTTTFEIPTITSDGLTAKVLELADKYPHAMYHKGGRSHCSYIEGEVEGTDFQGCIFGIALRELGVPKEFFEMLEEDGNAAGIYQVVMRLRIPFNESWRRAQQAQDWQFSWSYVASLLREKV